MRGPEAPSQKPSFKKRKEKEAMTVKRRKFEVYLAEFC